MDPLTHFLMEMDTVEEEVEEAHELQKAALVAIMYAGAEAARLFRSRRRLPSRLYLCRAQLLPNPHVSTPWVRLRQSRSDRAFITTMGFDVASFEFIIAQGFGHLWLETPIPRGDTDVEGIPRPGRRSLDAEGALGLVLHFLNSTMRELSLQQIFAVIPSTLSRYLRFSMAILLRTLRGLHDARISWPRELSEFEEYRDLVCRRHPLLIGAFASIDGLNLPVQTSEDIDIENATYNGWLSEHFVSSVLVFSSSGTYCANTDVFLLILAKVQLLPPISMPLAAGMIPA
jgi:hypothetical protein